MNIIEWTEEMSVNVKEIDAQHQMFLAIMNELYEAITELKGDIVLEDTIHKLSDYSVFHFKTEEKYFDEFQYEHAVEHKKQHEAFIAQINKLKENKDADKSTVAWELLDFMENWLVVHVETQDKQYTECFRAHGLS